MEYCLLDGVLPLNKEPGMTSHDCVQAVRRITGIKKYFLKAKNLSSSRNEIDSYLKWLEKE